MHWDPPFDLDDPTRDYETEGIIDRRRRNGKVEYLIQWKGLDERYNTWEPESALANTQDVLNDYYASKNLLCSECHYGAWDRSGLRTHKRDNH